MNRSSRKVLIAAVLAVFIAALAFMFVFNRPAVEDGGAGVDTNVGDSQPGDPDAGTGATPPAQ